MENEKGKEGKVNIEEVGIGEQQAKEFLKPEEVEIKETKIQNRQGNNCLVLVCKHPDQDDVIEITGIKGKKYGKLKVTGLWVSLDEAGTIPYNSALAEVLRLAKAKNIKELAGKKVATDIHSIDTPILVVKGY